MTRAAFFLACLLLLLPLKGEAEELALHMAPRELSFGEIFTHTSLTAFITAPEEGDVVVVFEGAPVNYALSRKERHGVFWLGGKRLVLHNVPSFYLLSSSKPLSEIADKETQSMLRLPVGTVLPDMAETADREFALAFLRLKQKNLHYGFDEGKIEKLAHNSFRTDFHIPSNVPVGDYKVRAWLFHEGKLVATGEAPYVIRKTGLNLALSDLIQRHQILSSMLTIALMLAVGLMGVFPYAAEITMTEPRIFLILADETREMEVALRYAAIRAGAVQGHVALLAVTQPLGMQLWRSVEERVAFEARREAEARLHVLGQMAGELSGRQVIYYFREGETREELIKLLEEDSYLSVLVLAAAKGREGPGTLVNYLSGRGLARLHVPFVVVPEDYVESRAPTLQD